MGEIQEVCRTGLLDKARLPWVHGARQRVLRADYGLRGQTRAPVLLYRFRLITLNLLFNLQEPHFPQPQKDNLQEGLW